MNPWTWPALIVLAIMFLTWLWLGRFERNLYRGTGWWADPRDNRTPASRVILAVVFPLGLIYCVASLYFGPRGHQRGCLCGCTKKLRRK